MVEFKHYPAIDNKGKEIEITIATGPVIIKDGKVLLDKHDDPFWKFPGGKQLSESNFPDNAKREVKEELGIDVRLKGNPAVLAFERDYKGRKEYVLLFHYLAEMISTKIKPGRDVTEYAWHDINNLPEDCAPNIKPIVDLFKGEL